MWYLLSNLLSRRLIWYDNNNNGIQDDGEEGVSDVKITLYNSANEELGTDTTDSSGKYEFCNLSSDDYYIVVDKSTLPDGYEITSQNQGDDDSLDSDINPDDGKSDTVTIADVNFALGNMGLLSISILYNLNHTITLFNHNTTHNIYLL